MNRDAEDTRHRTSPIGADNDWKTLRNPNVRRVLLFCFVNGMCLSLWFTQVFQIMVNKLSGDTTVGWLSATGGTAQMVGALIASLAGNLPRQETIRCAAFSGVVAVALSLYGVAVLQVSIFFFSSGLWGLYMGMVATGTEALFADSVETGKRDFVYNLKWMNETLCNCVGSLVSLLMLLRLGNNWDMHTLKMLMYIGLVLHPIAHLVLLTLKDKYALSEDEQQLTPSEKQLLDYRTRNDAPSLQTLHPHASDANGDIRTTPSFITPTTSLDAVTQREYVLFQSETSHVHGEEAHTAVHQAQKCARRFLEAFWCFVNWLFECSAVPYILCLGDLCVSIGSGMTLRYIPLFFVNDYGVKPVTLMGTYIAVYVTTALFSSLVAYLGRHCISRVVAVIFIRVFGTTLLLLIALTHLPVYILLPIFVIRNAAMNSTLGTTRSVIMDCVRKESRAKWSAFESFTSFTWAGSAVVGGYIAEAKGYQFTFLVTAIFHYLAMMMMLPAIYGARNLERSRRRQQRQRMEEADAHSQAEGDAAMTTPRQTLLSGNDVARR